MRLVILVVAVVLSLIGASEAAKFDRWFHFLTLETIAAFSLNPSDHVIHQRKLRTPLPQPQWGQSDGSPQEKIL